MAGADGATRLYGVAEGLRHCYRLRRAAGLSAQEPRRPSSLAS